MSVTTKNYKEGTTTSASQVNTDYSAIATETGNITTDSIRTGGVTRLHFAPTESFGPALTWWDTVSESVATQAYNDENYILIDHGNDMKIIVAETLHEGDTLRIHGGVFTTTGTQDSADTDGAVFKFQFYWDIGAGFVPIEDIEYKYSYACREPGAGTESVYNQRRLGFSNIYIHTGADIIVYSIQCRIAVTNLLNSITLHHTNMFATITRH